MSNIKDLSYSLYIDLNMPRKVVRVYIPRELKPILEELVEGLGLSESEIFRMAFLEYANKHGLVTERLKH